MSQPRSLSRSWLFLFLASISLPHRLAIGGPTGCAQDPLCRSHLDRGVALDLARQYEPALHEFQAAYQRQKDPRVAVNIGRTLHKLGRFPEALSWYKDAGRTAPADTELQKQLQEFVAQAKQNLPEAAAARSPVSIVNQPTFTTQTAPVQMTTTATSINNNIIKIELGSLRAEHQPAAKPLYQRASLWVPLVGAVLAASAAGIAISDTFECPPTCKQPMGCRWTPRLPRSNNTVHCMA